MNELIWINGQTTSMAEAHLNVEDRGFQFADGVYEVIRLYGGKPFTLREHLQRLEKSATAIGIELPLKIDAIEREIRTFLPKAAVKDGMVYLQLTRGASPRNHLFPANPKPTLLFYARTLPSVPPAGTGEGVKIITVEDDRWQRCWIKSIALLPNILAKNAAASQGADEAAFVDNGIVNECCSSNLFVVIDGTLITHPVGKKVLPGITRAVLLHIAKELDIPTQERPITLAEAKSASEVFVSSTTREISWVAQWDDHTIARKCGETTLRLLQAYQNRVRADVESHESRYAGAV